MIEYVATIAVGAALGASVMAVIAGRTVDRLKEKLGEAEQSRDHYYRIAGRRLTRLDTALNENAALRNDLATLKERALFRNAKGQIVRADQIKAAA